MIKFKKSMALVALVLLASVIVLVGCDTNAGDTPSSTGGTTQQPGSEGTGGESVKKAEDLTLTIEDANGISISVTLQDANSDGYYEIGTANELYAFAAAVNDEGKTTIKGKLTSNIVVNETVLDEQGKISENVTFRLWTPIGNDDTPYTGTFDGARYTISGLYFNDTNANYAGLFGYLAEGGSVQNLGVLDSYFCGGWCVGGVVGRNYGDVSNCYNKGDVSRTAGSSCHVGGVVGYNDGDVTNCHNTGSVRGTATSCYVGGVVGHNWGDVSNCYNKGDVIGTSKGSDCKVGGVVGESGGQVNTCYNTGDVIGTGEGSSCSVGGVVGSGGQVNTCYNTGDVRGTSDGSSCSVGGVVGNGGQVNTCYNTGDVIGTATGEGTTCNVGGVVGVNRGTVSNCHNTGAVSGTSKGSYCNVGGVVGDNSGDVSNCYNKGDVIGTSDGSSYYVGGVVGENYPSSTVTNCYNEGNVSDTATGEGSDCYVGGVMGQNWGEVSTCYYLRDTAAGGINGKDKSGQAEVKDKSFFEGKNMATFLNANQEDAPWEYNNENSAPTLKAFNKG